MLRDQELRSRSAALWCERKSYVMVKERPHNKSTFIKRTKGMEQTAQVC